jgi:hypothetical protein
MIIVTHLQYVDSRGCAEMVVYSSSSRFKLVVLKYLLELPATNTNRRPSKIHSNLFR